MKDTKYFEQALELVAPWKVVDVNMDVAAKRVEVKVDCGSAEMWLDPQSGQRLHIHGYEQRRWRHLPTMQFETIIVAQSVPQAQRENIEAAAMDMSAGFAAATAQQAPHVVMVHDKFHVAKMLNEAVDRVRRKEHKELLKQTRATQSRQLWQSSQCPRLSILR